TRPRRRLAKHTRRQDGGQTVRRAAVGSMSRRIGGYSRADGAADSEGDGGGGELGGAGWPGSTRARRGGGKRMRWNRSASVGSSFVSAAIVSDRSPPASCMSTIELRRVCVVKVFSIAGTPGRRQSFVSSVQ